MYLFQVDGHGADLDAVRMLFREYAGSLNGALQLHDFESELARLPGEYGLPDGRLMLAVAKGDAIGCVALRRIGTATCEMKRLYVRTTFRGAGIARGLTEGVVTAARRMGYRRMQLETLPMMWGARSLYRSMGFQEITPHYRHPVPGAVYMELRL
jgi:ribosomal protein S18 acetylase RimI-like enzyme